MLSWDQNGKIYYLTMSYKEINKENENGKIIKFKIE